MHQFVRWIACGALVGAAYACAEMIVKEWRKESDRWSQALDSELNPADASRNPTEV